jgi:hypothetical protein
MAAPAFAYAAFCTLSLTLNSFHRLLASGMRLHPQSGPYAAPMVIYRYGELISFSNPLWIHFSCFLFII